MKGGEGRAILYVQPPRGAYKECMRKHHPGVLQWCVTSRPGILMQVATQPRQAVRCARAWEGIRVADGLGLDCGHYKWQQNQSHVDVAVLIPPNVASHQAPLLPTCLPPYCSSL